MTRIARQAAAFGHPRSASVAGREGGFTLIELVIVVAIIVMIMGISAPILASLTQQRTLRGAGDAIQVDFMKLRQDAASSGTPVFVVLEHWHSPMRLVAWGAEWDEINQGYRCYVLRSTIIPDSVWIDEEWLLEHCSTFTSDMIATMDYSPILRSLLAPVENNTNFAPTYDFPNKHGLGYSELEFNPSTDEDNLKIYPDYCLAYMIMPDGQVQMIGKENVPSPAILLHGDHEEKEIPRNGNADIVIRNADDRLYMDLNPMTGRIEYIQRPVVFDE